MKRAAALALVALASVGCGGQAPAASNRPAPPDTTAASPTPTETRPPDFTADVSRVRRGQLPHSWRLPQAKRLAVHLVGAAARLVLDPAVVADGEQLLAHLVASGISTTAERLTLLTALLAPVATQHLVRLPLQWTRTSQALRRTSSSPRTTPRIAQGG